MSELETPLYSLERFVLSTSHFSDSSLAAIDEVGCFHVVGSNHEGRSHLVTFSPDGELDQETVLTEHQADALDIDSSQQRDAEY